MKTPNKAIAPKQRYEYFPALLVFVVSMIIYGFTLAPTVTGEDSGELIAAAWEGGVAHPPGYPLWTMLGWLAIRIFFIFESVAFRVNLLSAILAASAAAVFCRTLQRFFGVRPIFAVTGAICFAAGRHLWSQAVITEVYTLHIILFCLILHFLLAWIEKPKNGLLYLISFLTGLALANHHLAVLLGPVLIITLLVRNPRIFLKLQVVIICILALAIGLLPYLYLPLAAGSDPYMNWGNPDNLENFQRHVLRQQYADESMHAPRSPHRILGHLGILWQWNTRQYTLFAMPLIIIGAMVLIRKNKGLFILCLGLWLIHTIGLLEILNMSFQRQDVFCTQVFQLPAYVITAIFLALGMQRISRIIAHLKPLNLPSSLLAYLPLALLLTITATNYQHNNMRNYYYAYDHAGNILESLSPNAILIPSGDHNTFPIIYRHFVEGLRPDVTLADKYGYIEYEIYKDMPQAVKIVRTHRQREEIEAWLIKNSRRPVYYTVKPRMDLLPEYTAATFGMLVRIVPPNQKLEEVEAHLPNYYYHNLDNLKTSRDHAATIILSDYYFHLASNALRQHNLDEAFAYIDRTAELSAGLKEEMNNLGTLLAEFGLNQQAIGLYERSAKLDHNYCVPRWNLAYLFMVISIENGARFAGFLF